MIKIGIGASKTQLKVEVNPGLSDNKVMYLYWECGSDWYAELLRSQVDEKLRTTLQKIREEAYNEGWGDAKKKRQRRTWFSGLF